MDERRDVARPVPQRRQMDRKDVQSESTDPREMCPLATARLRSLLVAATIRTSCRDGSTAADALDFLRLDGAEQFRLRVCTQIPDLIEEQCAGVRELESADSPRDGARERSALVAEHLALDEVARDRGAIDAHEWAIAARTGLVHGGRHQLLARSGLTADEHARIRWRDAGDQLRDLSHRSAGANQRTGEPKLRAQGTCVLPGLAELERRRQCQQHGLGRQRLLEEVERAELGGTDGVTQSGAPTHHDHRKLGVPLSQAGQSRQSIERTRHHEIEQDDVRRGFGGRGDCGFAIGHAARLVSLGRQAALPAFA